MAFPSLRHGLIGVVVLVLVGAVTIDIAADAAAVQTARIKVREDLAALAFPTYARQKVVYHVTEGGGWFGSHYKDVVGSLQNHVAAVGADHIDLRIVLTGRGVDLLRNPDAALREKIDTLRANGVRFLVCRNTLVASGTEPEALYNVSKSDIVRAGVAEIAALEAQGFVYMRL